MVPPLRNETHNCISGGQRGRSTASGSRSTSALSPPLPLGSIAEEAFIGGKVVGSGRFLRVRWRKSIVVFISILIGRFLRSRRYGRDKGRRGYNGCRTNENRNRNCQVRLELEILFLFFYIFYICGFYCIFFFFCFLGWDGFFKSWNVSFVNDNSNIGKCFWKFERGSKERFLCEGKFLNGILCFLRQVWNYGLEDVWKYLINLLLRSFCFLWGLMFFFIENIMHWEDRIPFEKIIYKINERILLEKLVLLKLFNSILIWIS